MLGAIVGDIVGSPYEFDRNNVKTTDFPLFSPSSRFTDDTVMTLAVAQALMDAMPVRGKETDEAALEAALVRRMREFGNRFPHAGYGARFAEWLVMPDPKPYNSFGNGSAMRVSPVAWAFDDLRDVERYAEVTARVSHNHPEGIKGAQATAAAVLLARYDCSRDTLRKYAAVWYGYDMSRTTDEIRPDYHHVESCQGTVPEALTAFLEAKGFEEALRLAVSLGGDSDTLAAITCSMAEAAWDVPPEIADRTADLLDPFLRDVLDRWEVWRAGALRSRSLED